MTRTDVHSPLNLVTEDYTYVWAGDNQERFWGGMPFTEEGLKFVQEINASLNNSPLERGHHQCHHCGANLRYAAILKHEPTGEYIAVGETCLENRFERASSDFHALRKAAELDRKAHRIQTAAQAFLVTVDPDIHDLLVKEAPESFLSVFTEKVRGLDITTDIRAKLWMYGDLSVNQVNLLGRLLIQEQERGVRQAARDAEVKVPAPEGRLAFTGVVVSRKFQDNDFGGVWKLTVKVETEAGVWLCWVSEPKSIEPEVGDTVTMTATLTRSDKDPSFCFGKRPASASILERAA